MQSEETVSYANVKRHGWKANKPDGARRQGALLAAITDLGREGKDEIIARSLISAMFNLARLDADQQPQVSAVARSDALWLKARYFPNDDDDHPDDWPGGGDDGSSHGSVHSDDTTDAVSDAPSDGGRTSPSPPPSPPQSGDLRPPQKSGDVFDRAMRRLYGTMYDDAVRGLRRGSPEFNAKLKELRRWHADRSDDEDSEPESDDGDDDDEAGFDDAMRKRYGSDYDDAVRGLKRNSAAWRRAMKELFKRYSDKSTSKPPRPTPVFSVPAADQPVDPVHLVHPDDDVPTDPVHVNPPGYLSDPDDWDVGSGQGTASSTDQKRDDESGSERDDDDDTPSGIDWSAPTPNPYPDFIQPHIDIRPPDRRHDDEAPDYVPHPTLGTEDGPRVDGPSIDEWVGARQAQVRDQQLDAIVAQLSSTAVGDARAELAAVENLRLWFADSGGNHFRVLGVSEMTTDDVIRKAWRRISMLVHPDKLHGVAWATEAQVLVNAAKQTLLDPQRRLQYTQHLQEVDAAIHRAHVQRQYQHAANLAAERNKLSELARRYGPVVKDRKAVRRDKPFLGLSPKEQLDLLRQQQRTYKRDARRTAAGRSSSDAMDVDDDAMDQSGGRLAKRRRRTTHQPMPRAQSVGPVRQSRRVRRHHA